LDKILESLSSHNLLPALESNMVEFWETYGRAAGSELYHGEDMVRVLTGVPVALFNGGYRACLAPDSASATIAETCEAIERWGVPFLWWVGPDDRPTDIGARLERGGFSLVGETPGLAIDLAILPSNPAIPENFSIKTVSDGQELEAWARVAGRGTGFSESAQNALVELQCRIGLSMGSHVRLYLGTLDGVPVASSTMVLHSGVAGIYAVATLPEARRRGIGAAMTYLPLLEARALGYRVGTLQASEMGYPIYRRMGFQDVCKFSLYLRQDGAAQ